MKRNAIETVLGAVVLVVAAVFLYFAYSTSTVEAVSGYDLNARFDRVGGLKVGADVRISGIKVGTVLSETLDPKTFLAVVHMTVEPRIALPVDTVASIASSGLLGDDFVALEPGNEDETIKPGGTISHTQAPMDIQSLIGQYIFSQGGAAGAKKPPGGATPQPPAPAPGK
jgi:phospholipid/cholesterol/gamma-HCH transport system substrate-binding protein